MLEIGAIFRPLIYTIYSGIGHVFVVRRGYVRITVYLRQTYARTLFHTLVYVGNVGHMAYCQYGLANVGHKLVVRYQYKYAMTLHATDTSIPTPMSTFPMQYVGKLDVHGPDNFLLSLVYVGIKSGRRNGVTGP